jgi:hypothetical protein
LMPRASPTPLLNTKAPMRTLEEKVRERIASLGGRASSSDLLPFLRVSKAAV